MYNTELRKCAEVNKFTSQLKRVFKISFFGIEMKVFECQTTHIICLYGCPDNFPQGKLPPVRVRVWFKIKVRIRVGGEFS